MLAVARARRGTCDDGRRDGGGRDRGARRDRGGHRCAERVSAAPAAPAAWCGAAAQADREPNVVAGNPIHWVYAIPSDGAGQSRRTRERHAGGRRGDRRLVARAGSGRDAAERRRELRVWRAARHHDGAPHAHELLSSPRSRAASRRSSDALDEAGLDSPLHEVRRLLRRRRRAMRTSAVRVAATRRGFGAAVVYLRSCAGVSTAAVAAHEVLHTLGAVSRARRTSARRAGGHACDTEADLMFPSIGGEPLSSKVLDPGRDDYYGHAGGWTDTQDSAWLVRLDGQAPLALTIAGPGSVTANVPGLLCSASCTTTWNSGQPLALDGDSERGGPARPLGWRVLGRSGVRACGGSGRRGHCHLRPGDVPAQRLGRRKGQCSELESGHHVPPALLGHVPLLQPRPPDGDAGEGVEAALVERRLPRREEHLHRADERRRQHARHVRSAVEAARRSGSVLRSGRGSRCRRRRSRLRGYACGDRGIRRRRERRDALQDPPGSQPLRGCRGRHQRRTRQRLRGRPREARIRHSEGVGLPRRPGRDRDPLLRGARRRLPARALGSRLLPHRGRSHRAASVRRGRGASYGLRGRHHRPRPDPRALRAGDEAGHPDVRGVLRVEARRRRRSLPGRDRVGPPARRTDTRSARRP